MDLNILQKMSSVKTFKKGEIIIQEGAPINQTLDEMYIILKGSVDVYKNINKPNIIKVASLSPGSFFGEMSLFLNKERTATVTAAEDVTLLAINRFNAYEFFEKQPEATFLLIRALCQRLEVLTNRYGESFGETPLGELFE